MAENKRRDNSLEYSSLLPSDSSTETNVIGTIIRRNELYTHVEDILYPEVFRSEVNAFIFRCIRWVIKSGKIADINSIIEAVKIHSKKTKEIIDESDVFAVAQGFSEETFYQDVERLVMLYRRRKAWETLQRMSQKVVDMTEDLDGSLELFQKQIDEVKGTGAVDRSIIDAKTALKNLNNVVQENIAGINKRGIKTGFRFSDEKGGLREEAVTVIAAFSGVGKTSLALNIATNVAKSGIPVAYYSLEMNATELWARIISSDSGISSNWITSFALDKERLKTFDTSVGKFMKIPLYIDEDATSTFDKTMRSVRTLAKQRGVKLFVIDYLQVYAQVGKGEKEEAVIANISRRCKNICKELGLHCLLLSQLRRDKDEVHPRMDMLRGSGQIEESADNVVLIDRPDARPEWGVVSYRGMYKDVETKGTAELNVSKGRNIGTGQYIVGFDSKLTKFYELEEIPRKKKKGDNEEKEERNDDPLPKATEQELPF